MIVEINGITGKTTLALNLVKQQYEENPDSVIMYFDLGCSLTTQLLESSLGKEYAEKIRIFKPRIQTVDNIFEILDLVLDTGAIDLIVLDGTPIIYKNKHSLEVLLKRFTEREDILTIIVNQLRTDIYNFSSKVEYAPMYDAVYDRYCDIRYMIDYSGKITKYNILNNKDLLLKDISLSVVNSTRNGDDD